MNTENNIGSKNEASALPASFASDGRSMSTASSRDMLTGKQSREGLSAYGERQARRRAQLRAAQARRRARTKSKTIWIEVTEAEKAFLENLKEEQAGQREDFYKRALLTGAKFLFNSGNRRGGKKRIQGGHNG